MFMDALSATLRKDVKKRKRRTSGSESTVPSGGNGAGSTKPATDGSSKSDGGKTAPQSPTTAATTASASTETTTVEGSSSSATPTTPTSPKTVVPTIAPMSFYRDTLAEDDESKETNENGKSEDGAGKASKGDDKEDNQNDDDEAKKGDEDGDEQPVIRKSKRLKSEQKIGGGGEGGEEEEEEEAEEDNNDDDNGVVERKKIARTDSGENGETEDSDKTELLDAVMNDVEKKMAAEAQGATIDGGSPGDNDEKGEDETLASPGKKPPGPGCGPDGPPGVLVIHRRKGPKKQLRWRAADELEEIRYFELDVTERCNVTKSFTDMKQLERVDERQKFLLARKVGSEDIMVERTVWRPLLLVDNVPNSPDGSQSLERKVQFQRERGCLQALYFNKHMIPDSPVEPDPVDTYQTADPVHIPLEDVTGNPDSVNDFTSMPWPDPKSTPPHESAAFNSPFFPSDLPPGAGGGVGGIGVGGFGPGGFPPPFPPGAAGALAGPAPWTIHPRPGALQPGMFPLNQPPPGMGLPGPTGAGGAGGGGSPNILSLPPNIPPPGMFPGATNFNAPPPDLSGMMGDAGRRISGAGVDRDYRSGPPLPQQQQQQWVSNNGRAFGQRGAGGGSSSYGSNRGGGGGGGPGGWNRTGGSTGADRGRHGEEGRGNYRGHWVQNNNNRGHNNNRGGSGRKW